MKIKINQPYALNEIGGRSNNEDSIFPAKGKATDKDNLFLVCDGVGGNEKGEVASRIVCDSFGEYFKENPASETGETYIQNALAYAEEKMDEYLQEHPESQGMATTLTLLNLHEKGATIAHVGDSRVYHIRNGKIIYNTEDHSYVNEMIKHGLLTPEEAENHPKKNIITRAVQGGSKPTKADVFIQNDIQKDDYFFLCTDGILEQISDEILVDILSKPVSDEEKIKTIQLRCEGNTKDNFSCYLVPVAKVVKETEDIPEVEVISWEDENGNLINKKETDPLSVDEIIAANPDNNRKRIKFITIIFIGLLLAWFIQNKFINKNKENLSKEAQKKESRMDKQNQTYNEITKQKIIDSLNKSSKIYPPVQNKQDTLRVKKDSLQEKVMDSINEKAQKTPDHD